MIKKGTRIRHNKSPIELFHSAKRFISKVEVDEDDRAVLYAMVNRLYGIIQGLIIAKEHRK